ncbi:BatD family protein [Pseudomonas sp. NW5]|uniref:BatD family protein n=1 Tax=Pseudomonas sp. NW5 TaxID=2934934 RepID=UPI002020DB17|nr:BatD family protein [Pseudomonas sp. NW5]MCL7461720.1 BatD family protein [Pseudomonas sp. NW5]
MSTRPMNPWILLIVWLASSLVEASGLTASVDRRSLTLGEIVELRLEADTALLDGRPDLQALSAQFEILETRLLGRDSKDGDGRHREQLLITLQPRLSGELRIPALQIGDKRSQPIRLQVMAARPLQAPSELAAVFIDAQLDQPRVYVQAQSLLTLRIFHSVALYDDSQLSPLEIEDVHVVPLGRARTYEQQINGVRHGVIEVRYALFPQRSGTLQIPPLLFSATALEESGSVPGLRSGRPLQVRSPSLRLEVRPRPADYPADQPWLPARSLQLEEIWRGAEGEIRVGDSLTRTLRLRAEGLPPAQLPEVAQGPLPEGLRRYPDQPRQREQSASGGLIGIQEQASALVPTGAGDFLLPAIEVFWWNTEEDRLVSSRLPERPLQVLASRLPAAPSVTPSSVETAPAARLWPWQLASLLLLCANLLTLALWWRARRQPAILRSSTPSAPSTRILLEDLRRACQHNDAQAARQALDAWARQQPHTLAELAARHSALNVALDGLNGALYSESGPRWQGESLWQAVVRLPAGVGDGEHNGELPPLYPR